MPGSRHHYSPACLHDDASLHGFKHSALIVELNHPNACTIQDPTLATSTDARGKTSIIPGWVDKFGDKVFHHVAVQVEDIEQAVARLQQKGVVFAGKIVGAAGGPLRQIFLAPETVDG